MLTDYLNWLKNKFSPQKAARQPNLRETGNRLRQTIIQSRPKQPQPQQLAPRRQPKYGRLDPGVEGRIEDNGPGKNVLIRNKYVREDTGTHDTLKIVDDSLLDTQEETGLDPYNTGQFDRSKNWDKRFRK